MATTDSSAKAPIVQDLQGVRVAPSPKIALLVFAGYLVTIVVGQQLFGGDIDFGDVAANASNTRDLVVLPVACAALYLTIVTSALGWWRPAIFEPRRLHLGRWVWAIPVLAIVFPLVDVLRSDHRGDFTSTHWWWLVVGFALVGYSEELMTRGLLLVGFRSEWQEKRVFLGTTLLFALMHGLNIISGQDVGTTIKQMVGVIPMAILFYVVRRVTGSLVWSMVVHGVGDFSLIVFGGTSATLNQLDTSGKRPWGVGIPLLLAVIVVLAYRKRMFSSDVDGSTDVAAAA